jgi:multiple sugar transport system substrate-binding protein
MLAFNDGVEPFTIDGKVNFNTQGMRDYLEWMRMLVNEKFTIPGKKLGEFRPYAASNNLLFGHDWPVFDNTARSINKELTPEMMYKTWGTTVLPSGKDGVNRTNVAAHSLLLMNGTKVPKAAVKFIEFIVGDEFAIKNYIAEGGFPPVTKSAFEHSPKLAENEFLKGFAENVNPSGVPLPDRSDFAQCAEIIMTAVQEVITTNNDVAKICETVQARLEALFK